MLENETEKVFYSVKIVHVLTRTEKSSILLSIVCFLARFLNQLGHSRQESWVFGCEKQETNSATQRLSGRRVSSD